MTAVTGVHTAGAARVETEVHPFRTMRELRIGDTVVTGSRTVTDEDVAHVAACTGDTFHAHTDPVAAAADPLFGGSVAHGYLVLSLAAGLCVDPVPRPVLADTGLDRLRCTKPVRPGDSIASCSPARPGPRARPRRARCAGTCRCSTRTTCCARRTSC